MSKFILPSGRIPRPFNQNVCENGKLYTQVGSCVACTFTKILEVINFVKTGEYVELSKGYMYGRNNYKGKKNPGMTEEYTLDVMLERGTVPVSMCNDYDEIPDIVEILEAREDIAELDKEAEKTKLESWVQLGRNNSKDGFKEAKEYLQKYLIPIAITLKNYQGIKYHSVVMVGFENDNILFCDHKGDDTIYKASYAMLHKAYYLDGGIEMGEFKKFSIEEFKEHISKLEIKRGVSRVQLHHTYSPSYKNFTGSNHIELQNNMLNYHVNTNGWADIGQHFTIFPDGAIVTGRRMESTPAGIKGANTGAICIECLGNFENGGDVMTDPQKNAIVAAVKILLDKFGLNAKTSVTYHAWWSADGRELGDYIKGHSSKTCPGTGFFGGNTLTVYERNLMPLIENYGKEESVMGLKPVTEINDIVWELTNAGIITDGKLWIKKCNEDVNVYWLCRKMANKLRGTL